MYDKIMTYLTAALPQLNSASVTAIYKKIVEVMAIILDNTVAELESTKSEIINIIGSQRYGRSGYYTQKALEYQEGVNLTVDENLNPVYASVDETKLLIKQASFAVEGQILTLKVAALDSDTGTLRALTTGEKQAFDGYFVQFEIPGIPVTKVSLAANVFGFNASVVYFSTYNLENIKSAITDYLLKFRNEFKFDGELFVNDLETYLKTNVEGIRNVSLSDMQIDGQAFSGSTKLSAGYFNYIDNITDNFTYVAI